MTSPNQTPDPQDTCLVFPRSGQIQGFATQAAVQWDGNPEPVVREILQNSLDACVKAGRQCEVAFTLRDVAHDEIPGFKEYEEHFIAAVRERGNSAQGPAEMGIIESIDGVLSQDKISVLFCRDNGIGLTPDTMKRVLSEGNTDKAESGAGAFGIGHLTAFAASDTRYVLYAGRSVGDGGSNGAEHRPGFGPPAEVASGHAILASRTVENSDGSVRHGLGGHGHLSRRDAGDRSAQLGLFAPMFPHRAPPLLARELDQLSDTGTVLCITGFNRFRTDKEDPVEAIARVSAKNFLVAINKGEMVVRVRDETTPEPQEYLVDSAGLRQLLKRTEGEKRIRGSGGGWLPGEQAYRCLRTMEEGEEVELSCGATARVRRLTSADGTATNVQLFRDGMWITNRADELRPTHFGGCNPFDAAIMIVEGGDIWKLVREAEGPEHRGLDRRRLSSNRKKNRLRHLLRDIQQELREHVGEIKETTDYTPDGFAIFGKRGGQLAEAVAPYQPRGAPAEEEGSSEATTLQPSDDPDSEGIDSPGGGGKKSGRGAKPQPGKSIRGRTAVLAVPNGGGEFDTLRVLWQPGKSRGPQAQPIAVRARIPSGSDGTDELPLPPKWLRLAELTSEGHPSAFPDGDPFEVILPDGVRSFDLKLASPIADPNVIEVDFVRRRPPAENSEQTT